MSNIVIYNVNGEISKVNDNLTVDGSLCAMKVACMVKARSNTEN